MSQLRGALEHVAREFHGLHTSVPYTLYTFATCTHPTCMDARAALSTAPKLDAEIVRAHIAELEAQAKPERTPPVEHEPQLYAVQPTVCTVNSGFTIAFLGCSCGWNSDGKAGETQKWSEHLQAAPSAGEQAALQLTDEEVADAIHGETSVVHWLPESAGLTAVTDRLNKAIESKAGEQAAGQREVESERW